MTRRAPARRLLAAAILLTLLAAPRPEARAADYMLKPISYADGLSQSSVKSILLDDDGYLWLATKYGLNRYGAGRMANYFSNPASPQGSITDNNVNAVFADRRDSVWVAGESGVAIYDRRRDRFRAVTLDGRAVNVHSHCDTPEGMLLGGAGRLFLYDYSTGRLRQLPAEGAPTIYYNRIHRWHGGDYLLETRWDGLWVYSPARGSVARYAPCPERDIMASHVDAQGNLWVSPYDDGLRCYAPDGTLTYQTHAAPGGLSNNIVIDLLDHDGSLWIATESGIDILDRASRAFSHLGRYDNAISVGTVLCLYKDGFGNIYAGTLRRGAICIQPVPMRTYTADESDEASGRLTVTALLDAGGGRVYVGVDGGGVLIFDPATDQLSPYPATAGMKVTSLAPYDERRLLVVTYDKGIFLFDTLTGAVGAATAPYREFARQQSRTALAVEVYELSARRMAIVANGLYIVDRATDRITPVANAAANPNAQLAVKHTAFYRDASQLMLFDNSRIYRYDLAGDTLATVATLSPARSIVCAQYDGGNRLWIGTDRGLVSYDIATGALADVAPRLIHNISLLMLDGDQLWAGADNVLYLLAGDKRVIFNRYDGMTPDELIGKATLATADYLYMGGINGLHKINRSDIAALLTTPSDIALRLADLTIDGVAALADVGDDGVVEVPNGHSSIIVRVIDKEQNIMRSKLFRFDVGGLAAPIETTDGHISLSMLPAGDYRIGVACSRADGTWTEPVEVVTLRVARPWWQSLPAMLLYLLAAAAAAYMGVRWARARRRKHSEAARRASLEREVGFLTNVNYELRTPLSLIYAPLKLLIQRLREQPGGGDPATMASLEEILRHTREMRDVINMPLELWRIDGAEVAGSLTHADFNQWLRQEADNCADAIELRRLRLDFSADAAVGALTFDRNRLSIVVANVLMAAIKHSPTDSQLTVATRLDGDGNVRVEVTDMGEGISPQDIDRIFSRHYNTSIYGAGLGLAYARLLIELLGGRIGIDSAGEGQKGVTVWFSFPYDAVRRMAPAGAAPEATPAPSDHAAAVADFDASDSTALVVEDNEELCMLMTTHLQEIFKKVHYAFNGKDALILIKREQPDIVIVDVALPIVSGIELCREVKSSTELQHIPVVLLTASNAEADKSIGYGIGADSCITKPFDLTVLMSRCKNLLFARNVMRNRYRSRRDATPISDRYSNADETFLMKVDSLIDANLSSPDFGVDMLVDQMLMSRSALYTRFKALTGKSIGTYIAEQRLTRAKELLRRRDMTINDVSEALGFRSQRYFSTFFKERTGQTPTAWRAANPPPT